MTSFERSTPMTGKIAMPLASFGIGDVVRHRIFDFRGAKLIPTFHPSFLLRSPGYKREAWDDLKLALTILGRNAPSTAPSAAE